jgi:hypothetical protein
MMHDETFWRLNDLWGLKGGLRSGICCYDELISGRRSISRATIALAMMDGGDALQNMIDKRNALLSRLTDVQAEIDSLTPNRKQKTAPPR